MDHGGLDGECLAVPCQLIGSLSETEKASFRRLIHGGAWDIPKSLHAARARSVQAAFDAGLMEALWYAPVRLLVPRGWRLTCSRQAAVSECRAKTSVS